MQRLQHVFQRAALALGLLTAGIGGGYGLYQPQSADSDTACVSTTQVATAAGTRAYVLASMGDNPSRSAAHAACSCGNA